MMLLPIHIIAGAIALASGFVALYALKGGKLHRKSGIISFYALLTMSVLGAVIAAWRGNNEASVIGGVLTAYLVTTALISVRPPVGWSRRLDVGLMLVALVRIPRHAGP